MHKYKAHTVGEAAKIIVDEVAEHGESYWEGAQDPKNHEIYEGLKTFMKNKNIIPLDDMFGSWVSREKIETLKDYTVIVKHSVRACCGDDARDKWAEGDYDGHEILSVVCEDEIDKPLHIVYWRQDGCTRYRMSDGSTGSSKGTDAKIFESYWRNTLADREITFEDIT